MNVIKLNRTDISEMVKRAVHSILNESVSEVMGSAMAGKEEAIQDMIDYIEKKWDKILRDKETPADSGTFTLNDPPGLGGQIDTYLILVPHNLTRELGIAENFEFNIAVQNYIAKPNVIQHFGHWERGTKGTSYGGPEYDKYLKPKMRVKNSRIDLYVPAVNGELQIQGMISTIYHELNHNMTQLQTKIKKQDRFDNDQLNNTSLFTMTKRKGENPHYTTARELKPDPLRGMLQTLSYGPYAEAHRAMNFLFYGLWETTERNARAEAIYGDLMALKSKRENFNTDYQKTDLCHQIAQFKELLDTVSQVPAEANNWRYASNVMNMKRRGLNKDMSRDDEKFLEEVKERFIKRTNELIEMLYKKGMKVAEHYYQEHEPKKEKSRLEKYKEEHGL